jgi:hypothetical protein
MTFTREPMAHWITMFNNTQPYKPLPVTSAQTTIRPTNWPFSQRLYSRYELCNCNTFSEYAGDPQHHFYIQQIRPETGVSKNLPNADHPTLSWIKVVLCQLPTSHPPITAPLPTAATAGWYINTTYRPWIRVGTDFTKLGTICYAVYHVCRCCSLYNYEVVQVWRCNLIQ